MDIDILQLSDLDGLKLSEINTITFTCEKCGKRITKKPKYFRYKKDLICTSCKQSAASKKRGDPFAAARAAIKKNNEQVKQKRKQTLINHYGEDATKIIAEKRKKTIINKYGVENISQLESAKLKKEQTMIEHYGVKTNSQRKELKESLSKRAKETGFGSQKFKDILVKKYGVDHNSKIESSNNKRSIAMQQIANQDDFIAKRKETLQKRYNVTNPFQLKKVIDNTIERNKLGHVVKRNAYLAENNLTFISDDDKELIVKCNKCNNQYAIIKSPLGFYCYHLCPICYPTLNGKSYEEKEIADYIKSIYNDDIIENSRKIIPPKEIDIYLPKLKFGIEYNGLYWHSGDKHKHREKWKLAQQNGIDLIQIWDYEWKEKKEIIKSIISNRLGLSIPIYARNCEIKQVPVKEAREFAEAYHLQGFYPGIYIGLYYNNDLIDLSIFCKCRFGKQYDYELTRHCIKSGFRVIGALSKEIAYFRKLGYQGTIVDYCDMRLFNGKGHWGFKEMGITPPDMQYTDFVHIIPRGKYQKWKMKNIKGFIFDPSLTQRENLQNNGMDFVFGVGHKIFVCE
jgi:hypothetical protein